jgi:hypothetical protein
MSNKLPLFENFTGQDADTMNKLGVPDTHQFFVYTYQKSGNLYGALLIADKSMNSITHMDTPVTIGESDLKKYKGSLIGVSFMGPMDDDPYTYEMLDLVRPAFEGEYLSNVFDESFFANNSLVSQFSRHIDAVKSGRTIMDWNYRLDQEEFYY